MDYQAQLFQAIEQKNIKLIKSLVEMGAELNELDPKLKTTPFIHAMKYFKKSDQIEKLIDMGGELNSKNYNGETPLMVAIQSNCEYITPWVMVDMGANLDTQDNNGNTAIMRLLMDKDLLKKKKLLYCLLDYKPDLTNIKNNKGQTCFDIMFALIMNN